MGKNLKQVLVFVIVIISLMLVSIPIITLADNCTMSLDIKMYNHEDTEFAKGNIPPVSFSIKKQDGTGAEKIVTTDRNGHVDIGQLENDTMYTIRVADSSLKTGYEFLSDLSQDKVFPIYSDWKKLMDESTDGSISFLSQDGFNVQESIISTMGKTYEVLYLRQNDNNSVWRTKLQKDILRLIHNRYKIFPFFFS